MEFFRVGVLGVEIFVNVGIEGGLHVVENHIDTYMTSILIIGQAA